MTMNSRSFECSSGNAASEEREVVFEEREVVFVGATDLFDEAMGAEPLEQVPNLAVPYSPEKG